MINTNQSNNFGAIGQFLGTSNKIKNAELINFNLVEFPLPSYNLPPVRIGRLGEISDKPGDTVTYDTSVVTKIILDEDLKIYFALIDLMYKYASQGTSDDLLLIQKMNNQNNLVASVVYNNSWITNISEILFDTQSDETYMYVLATVSYSKPTLNPPK